MNDGGFFCEETFRPVHSTNSKSKQRKESPLEVLATEGMVG